MRILSVAVGGQEPRFNTETSLVEVDVVVRDSNRQAVTALMIADFTVFEDDVRQWRVSGDGEDVARSAFFTL